MLTAFDSSLNALVQFPGSLTALTSLTAGRANLDFAVQYSNGSLFATLPTGATPRFGIKAQSDMKGAWLADGALAAVAGSPGLYRGTIPLNTPEMIAAMHADPSDPIPEVLSLAAYAQLYWFVPGVADPFPSQIVTFNVTAVLWNGAEGIAPSPNSPLVAGNDAEMYALTNLYPGRFIFRTDDKTIRRFKGPSAVIAGFFLGAAGTVAVQGIYTRRGTANAKDFYVRLGAADSAHAAGQSDVWWTGTAWQVRDASGGVRYTSAQTVAYPWLVTTWTAGTGATPLPVVTSVTQGELDAGVTLVDPTGGEDGIGLVAGANNARCAYVQLNGGGPDGLAWSGSQWTDADGTFSNSNVAFPWQAIDAHLGDHDGYTITRNDVASAANWETYGRQTDLASPGDIGGTTPGNVTANNLVVFGSVHLPSPTNIGNYGSYILDSYGTLTINPDNGQTYIVGGVWVSGGLTAASIAFDGDAIYSDGAGNLVINGTIGSDNGTLPLLCDLDLQNFNLINISEIHTDFAYLEVGLSMLEKSASSVPTPPAGYQTCFVDSSDHKLKRKNASGTVTIIG